MDEEEARRTRARNLQLQAALGAARDMAELGDLEGVKRALDGQGEMSWADWDPAEPWRDLVRTLVAHDEACPSPGCRTTMLGHLLGGCTEEEVAMVRSVDPTDGVARG